MFSFLAKTISVNVQKLAYSESKQKGLLGQVWSVASVKETSPDEFPDGEDN